LPLAAAFRTFDRPKNTNFKESIAKRKQFEKQMIVVGNLE